MTKEERRILYKKALKDYKLANNWLGKLLGFNTWDGVRYGFCAYFRNKHGLRITPENVPELWTQCPKVQNIDFMHGYWFTPAALPPRIKALQAAIDLCKD